jgi:hypothetical protein
MSNKLKRVYRRVAVEDGTYTVEISDGTNVITKMTGFPSKASADTWIKEQQLADMSRASE